MTRDELARAVVALPGFPVGPATFAKHRRHGTPHRPATSGMRWLWHGFGVGWVPDLSDAATGGALLDLLRAAWVTDPDRWLAICLDVGDDGPPATVECFGPSAEGWRRPPHTGTGSTLAEAAAAALAALGRCGGAT